MKILLVNKASWIGGVETLMIALSSVFRAAGHECELFFFERGPMEKYLPADEVAHFGDLEDCMRLVRERGFDIVHGNSSNWELGISILRRMGARLVVTAHGWVVPSWNSTNCDTIVACAGWLAGEQQALTDLPISVVYNGVDTDKFAPAPEAPAAGPPIIAWIGRGVAIEQKRIEVFAAAAPALRRAGARVWLAEPYGAAAVVGAAPEAAPLLHALRDLAEFWGAVPVEEMPDFYREVAASGGCLVSTSSYEGLPMTLLEAQACGCPVVAPDVRGINECVDPAHGGVLYPPDLPPEELAGLVLETVGDAERMRWRRGACSRHVRERFSLRRMAQEYLRLYEEQPSPRGRNLTALRARYRLSPIFNWGGYVAARWRAGSNLFEMSQNLAARGEWKLASACALAALNISPTLYVRPSRLAHLLKTQVLNLQ